MIYAKWGKVLPKKKHSPKKVKKKAFGLKVFLFWGVISGVKSLNRINFQNITSKNIF